MTTESGKEACEGVFDAQMMFDVPYFEVPQPIRTIIKRDGRQVAFNKEKIAEAIFKAAQAVDGHDRDIAKSLASGVTIYLTKTLKERPPTVDHIHDAVEKVLIEMGHAKTALSYVRYRDRRTRMRSLRKGIGTVLEHTLDREKMVFPSDNASLPTLTDNNTKSIGIPLSDAENIICGPDIDNAARLYGPDISDKILAKRIKQEFAFQQVYSKEVADAHQCGEIHINELEFVDRLHASVISLEYLKLFGSNISRAGYISNTPGDCDDLSDQLVLFNDTLSHYFNQGILWDSINFYFAPFIDKFSKTEIQRAANLLVNKFIDCSYNVHEKLKKTLLGLRWTLPDYLESIEAVGHDGIYTGRDYSDYMTEAREFANAVIVAIAECDAPACVTPIPVIFVNDTFWELPGHEDFLECSTQLSCLKKQIQFIFKRNPESDYKMPVWLPQNTVFQQITLNLVRAAYRTDNEEALFAELDRICKIAFAAHDQKRIFIEKLLSLEDMGTLALLACKKHNQQYLKMEDSYFITGLLGLNECVKHITGGELGISDVATKLGQRILIFLSDLCGKWRDETGIQCYLSQIDNRNISNRLATHDLAEFTEIADHTVDNLDKVRYTSGARLNMAHEMGPFEQIQIEAQLFQYVNYEGTSILAMPDADSSKESVADLIKKAFFQTQSKGIEYSNLWYD